MSLDRFKEFGLDTTKHGDSRVRRFRSMLQLLEQDGITNINEVQLFIDNVEKEVQKEEISNILSAKFNVKYAHTTARDRFNALKSMLEEFSSKTENTDIDTLTTQASEDLNIKQVISLAEELNRNDKNLNLDNELKEKISKLILQEMQITISKFL